MDVFNRQAACFTFTLNHFFKRNAEELTNDILGLSERVKKFMNYYISSIILSFFITLLSIPLVKKLAFRSNFVDKPNPKNPGKIHKKATPLLGGLSVLLGVFTSIILFGGMRLETLFILSLALIMFIIGLVDDKVNLSYKIRLLVQFIVAIIFVTVFIFSNIINPFYGKLIISGIAIFWIAGIINAINLMDNIDGATGGITALSSSTLLTIALYQHNHLPGIISSALLASALAFLIFNYSPASIFLGDGGTLLIGFFLAATALIEAKELLYNFSIKSLAFPFVLGFPIYDTTFATVRRIVLKRPIYRADGSNLTYRLLSQKIPKQKVVFIEYGLQAFFCIVALCILWGNIYIISIAAFLGFLVPVIIGRFLF